MHEKKGTDHSGNRDGPFNVDLRLAVRSGAQLLSGSSLNSSSNSCVCAVNCLNSSSSYSVVSAVYYNFLNCSNYRIRINGLSLLAAIAGNHSYAEQNSKR